MTVEKTKGWTGVTGGGTWGQKALMFLFHFHNVTIGYVFLALVVPFYMLFARKGYLSIYRYFRQRFQYSPFKSFRKTYQNHFVFGQCMLDRFAVYAGRRNFFKVKITGNEHFERLLNSDKGFLIASSHVGNFELSGYLLKQDKKAINALIFGDEAKEVMENRIKALKQNNISVIPVRGDMSHFFAIHAAFDEGQIVSMPCDRNFGSAKSVACDFLGAKADFPLGAFTFATHFDVPVLTIFVMKESVSNYHVYVKPLTLDEEMQTINKREKANRLAASFSTELETIVRKYPEQWFNFYNFWK